MIELLEQTTRLGYINHDLVYCVKNYYMMTIVCDFLICNEIMTNCVNLGGVCIRVWFANKGK